MKERNSAKPFSEALRRWERNSGVVTPRRPVLLVGAPLPRSLLAAPALPRSPQLGMWTFHHWGWVSGASGSHSSACPEAGDTAEGPGGEGRGLRSSPLFFSSVFFRTCGFSSCDPQPAGSLSTWPYPSPTPPFLWLLFASILCHVHCFLMWNCFRVLKMTAFKINIYCGVQHILVF